MHEKYGEGNKNDFPVGTVIGSVVAVLVLGSLIVGFLVHYRRGHASNRFLSSLENRSDDDDTFAATTNIVQEGVEMTTTTATTTLSQPAIALAVAVRVEMNENSHTFIKK
jgi:hypothetical protein